MNIWMKRFSVVTALALGLAAAPAYATTLSFTSGADAIYIYDGGLVDMTGAPTASSVGGSPVTDWNPQTGQLFAAGGANFIFRHNGTSWTFFSNLTTLGITADTNTDLAISPNGILAFTDVTKNIYLMNQAGALVDMSGAPTASPIGTGSAVEWNYATGNLFAFEDSSILEHDGASWSTYADLTLDGITADTSSDLAIDSTGLIALVDDSNNIYLVNAAGIIVDFTGAPTAALVGISPTVAFDPSTDNLWAWGGKRPV